MPGGIPGPTLLVELLPALCGECRPPGVDSGEGRGMGDGKGAIEGSSSIL